MHLPAECLSFFIFSFPPLLSAAEYLYIQNGQHVFISCCLVLGPRTYFFSLMVYLVFAALVSDYFESDSCLAVGMKERRGLLEQTV